MTVGSLLQKISHTLKSTSPTPQLDAEVLMMHATGLDRSALMTSGNAALANGQELLLEKLLARRLHGEPIAYITGVREFWSMELNVTPATLIPRPETELLVEKALTRIPKDATWKIADLGTGAGAIALALAKERPHCHLIATDISSAALETAQTNIKKLRLKNIELRQGSWFVPLADEKLDMIVSNPPYVNRDDPHLEQGDVRFEPQQALIAGLGGFDAVRHISMHAQEYLKDMGKLLLEHGWDQAVKIHGILHHDNWRMITHYPDFAGHNRVIEAVTSKSAALI
ncbi:MAG: peptide chain release factor N(5)-glutamine methyltransferase [Gammaproteobacteria bacterium]|nr:peptide chain release factor N(5)-glutamine methyltransferase [Gammaproteobacteria bacterium]